MRVRGVIFMENKKHAWIYCAIDAPEDTHGTLKGQRQQLMDYAEQMGFEVVGSSSDMGNLPLFERPGFKRFTDVARTGRADILLVINENCLSRSSMQLAQLQALAESYEIKVYSPLLGAILYCQ